MALRGNDAPFAPGADFWLPTGMHSHNDYLQTWYETGAVGALMLLGHRSPGAEHAGACLDTSSSPISTRASSTLRLLGGSSFSLWQPWFMASFGLTAVFAMLGWAMADRSGAREQDRFRSLHALNAPGGSALPIARALDPTAWRWLFAVGASLAGARAARPWADVQ